MSNGATNTNKKTPKTTKTNKKTQKTTTVFSHNGDNYQICQLLFQWLAKMKADWTRENERTEMIKNILCIKY